jgi:hypothetical protein
MQDGHAFRQVDLARTLLIQIQVWQPVGSLYQCLRAGSV